MKQEQESLGNLIPRLEGDSYLNFVNSLKSEVTKECYKNALVRFLKFCEISSTEDLARLSPAEIEFYLKRYLENQKQNNSSYSSMTMITNTVNHFCTMNDIVINSRKISKFKTPTGNGKGKGQEQDEAYSRPEIQKLLNVASLRMRVCILVYASTGIRKSALPSIQLRHLEKIDKASLYELVIYSGEKEQYITFCTPECAKTIDEYLDYRTRLGEILTPDSYLIREDFDINDIEQIRSKSRKISERTIGSAFYALSIKAGIRQRAHDKFARKRVPLFHGFRKFFTTQLTSSGVNPIHGLMLEGHSTGIRDHYARPPEQEKLAEYMKAVNNLTINEENRQRLEIQALKQEKTNYETLDAKIDAIHREFLERSVRLGAKEQDSEYDWEDMKPLTEEEIQQRLRKRRIRDNMIRRRDKRLEEDPDAELTEKSVALTF